MTTLDWRMMPINKIADVKRGASPRPIQDARWWGNGAGWVRISDVTNSQIYLRETKDYLSADGEALSVRVSPGEVIMSIAATVGLPAIVAMNACIHDGFIVFRNLSEEVDSKYLYYSIVHNRNLFLRSGQHGSQSNINSEIVGNTIIPLPPLPEQRKIAEILGTWDEAIRLTADLIAAKQQRKKGLMQRLLTGEVRFPEFAGRPWKEISLNEIFTRVTRKNKIGNTNVLTASAQFGLISQIEFFNRSVAGKDLSSYYLIRRGEFAYNRSSAAGYPFGAIKRLDRYDEGILSTLYICFKLKDSNHNSDFLAHYFEAGLLDSEIYGIASEGARSHGLLNVGTADFFDLWLNVPSYEEQTRIAEVLNACDHEIDLLQQKLAALQQQKKGLMQRLLTGAVRVTL